MILCDKKVFVKALRKFKCCMRLRGHNGGQHTPNLIGERFGSAKVIGLGNKKIVAGGTITTWIIEQGGFRRAVQAGHLISGRLKGKCCRSDFPTTKNGKVRPEYATVAHHYRYISDVNYPAYKYYKNMPFHGKWNPTKGGAFWRGAKWIIENLGEKPGVGWSLDVMDHEKGFVPGNLRWATRRTQNINQQYRVLGRYSVKDIRIEAKRLGYKLVKL